MSDATSVQNQIAELFRSTLKIDLPSADTDLFESGVLDSTAFVELLLGLEHTFGLKVAVEELEIENFRSIRRIADFVMARNGSSRPVPE